MKRASLCVSIQLDIKVMLGSIQSLIILSSEPGDFGTMSCELLFSALPISSCSHIEIKLIK